MPYEVFKQDGKYCVRRSDTKESKGCSDSKQKAMKHMAALYASEKDTTYQLLDLARATSEEGSDLHTQLCQMLDDLRMEKESEAAVDTLADAEDEPKDVEIRWSGPIVFENLITGDNRVFQEGALEWDEHTLPWSFRWQRTSGQGHGGAVPVGRVDKLERRGDVVWGFGVIIPSLNDEAKEYLHLLQAGVAGGVSVDGDSAEFTVEEQENGKGMAIFSNMRLRSLTAVDIPAFNEAKITLMDKEEDEDTELAKTKRKRNWSMADYALTAGAIPVKPSIEAFQDPSFDGPTPLTVGKDGEVFGHLALWDTCHISYQGPCVKPPRNSTYRYFHTGELETFEGDTVEVGHLTFNTGHADTRITAAAAAHHYDHTGTVAADVRAGQDKFGIWVVGALRPHLTDADIRAFRAAPLSGDWRRIAGRMELVGALAVNTPGFHVPRAKALVASGEIQTLFTYSEVEDAQLREQRKAEIAMRAGVELSGLKVEDGKKFPAADYAYVPDPEKSSTWKLRLTDTPGGDPDPRIVGAAVAALGEGFRGQKVEIPEDDLPRVKDKVRAAWKKANPDKSDEDVPEVIASGATVELEVEEIVPSMTVEIELDPDDTEFAGMPAFMKANIIKGLEKKLAAESDEDKKAEIQAQIDKLKG